MTQPRKSKPSTTRSYRVAMDSHAEELADGRTVVAGDTLELDPDGREQNARLITAGILIDTTDVGQPDEEG